jgi:hypothetical protein
MPLVSNDKGDVLYLTDDKQWKPAQTRKNDQGQIAAFDGKQWNIQDGKQWNPAPPKLRSWSQVPGEAISNIPSSAGQLASDIAQPFIHPVDTYENVKNIGKGALQKLGIVSGSDAEPYADAVGKFLMDRYGSAEAIKNTLATDPVGVAADLSMILSGGETAAARLPAAVGKAGEVAGTVGRAIDPLSAAGKAVEYTGRGAAKLSGDLGSHVGSTALRSGAAAGYEGGQAAKTFQENMRGNVPVENVVADARSAVGNMRKERGQEYVAAMKKIGSDKTVLNFDKVDKALADISQVKTYKGQVIEAETQGIRGQIGQAVQEWKQLDPVEYHTAEGLDALKQKIGSIRDATEYGTPARRVADQAYHAIRQTIVDQAPEYGRIMKGYEEASTQIKEIERTLSLNPNASIDTALRKLQSVLRNNVNTNYGQRAKLAEYLVNSGAPHLMEALAGQALSSWIPRGLAKLAATQLATAGAGLAAGGVTGAGLTVIPTLAAMSPRFTGEAAYYAGKASKNVPARALARGAYQEGRENPLDNDSPLAQSGGYQ